MGGGNVSVNKTARFGILLLCMLSGLTIGNFIGELCSHLVYLKWMNYKQVFGFDSPFQVNLGAILLAFQIQFNITISGILGMVLGVFVYKKI